VLQACRTCAAFHGFLCPSTACDCTPRDMPFHGLQAQLAAATAQCGALVTGTTIHQAAAAESAADALSWAEIPTWLLAAHEHCCCALPLCTQHAGPMLPAQLTCPPCPAYLATQSTAPQPPHLSTSLTPSKLLLPLPLSIPAAGSMLQLPVSTQSQVMWSTPARTATGSLRMCMLQEPQSRLDKTMRQW
jgi:hypothetical protein